MNVLVLFPMERPRKMWEKRKRFEYQNDICLESFLFLTLQRPTMYRSILSFSTCLLKLPLCCFPIWNLSTSTWLFADSVLLCIRYCRHVSLHSCYSYSYGHEGIFTFRSTKLFSASVKLPISTRADSLTLLHAIGVTCSSNLDQIFMILPI